MVFTPTHNSGSYSGKSYPIGSKRKVRKRRMYALSIALIGGRVTVRKVESEEFSHWMKSVVCAGIAILAVAGCAAARAAIVTTTYEFMQEESTVTVYGYRSGAV